MVHDQPDVIQGPATLDRNRSGSRRAGLKDACWLQGILRLCGATRSIWCTAVVPTRSRL